MSPPSTEAMAPPHAHPQTRQVRNQPTPLEPIDHFNPWAARINWLRDARSRGADRQSS